MTCVPMARFVVLSFVSASFLIAAGCSVETRAPGEATSSSEEEIQAGQIENGFPAVTTVSSSVGGCTGTLIAPNVVLTAKHCDGNNDATGLSAVASKVLHPSKDLMLLKLSSPVWRTAPMNVTGALPAVGTVCTAVGFGNHNETVNGKTVVTGGTKRSCTEKVESADSSSVNVVMVTGVADHGDSGGPLVCNGSIPAVVRRHDDGNWPAHIRETYTPIDLGWITQNAPTANTDLRWYGVWEPTTRGQTFATGWEFGDFAARFNSELSQGRHLVHLQAYDTGDHRMRWDGVFESGNTGQGFALGWAFNDFTTRFQQELNQGRHLTSFQAYDIGGSQIRYDGVFESGATGQSFALGWAFNDFVNRYQSEINQGRHLVTWQAYDIGGNQIRYDGVWEPGAKNQTFVLGWAFNDFVNRFQSELNQGRHLVTMHAYDIGGGQIRYDGVFEPGNPGQTFILGWAFNDFTTHFQQELNQGRHLTFVQAVDIGGGQLRYDAVFEPGNTGQSFALGWAFNDMSGRLNTELSAGRHVVQMLAK